MEPITPAAEAKKVMLSGIQPSGNLHLGNYLGAVKNWAELADQFDCYYFMADLHSITVRQDPKALRARTLELLALYIACGLDPEKNTLFIQSHVHEHAELAWVLNCYTMFGELSRMTQFKDKSAKNSDNINAGLFAYPALMAADILLYQPDFVPVGQDQKQHCELTRDIAIRFNNLYGSTFKVPEPYIPKVGARVMSLSTPTSKMSKSDPNGCVFLMDTPEDISRKFKRAVTDSDTENCVRYAPAEKPGVANLMSIYSSVTGKTFEEIEKEFDGMGYGKFKPAVGDAVVETLRPIREEAQRILADKAYLQQVYTDGAQRATYVARKTLRKVYKKVGFIEKPF
ncbi:MAG: tryptophan--tRNA ligase [Oscillospiraceae bacterium]|nr:tryptophan--tRNA ligase [Oscillospiraceae bacterium]